MVLFKPFLNTFAEKERWFLFRSHMLLKAGKYIIGRYFPIGKKEIIERYLSINT